MTELIPVQQVIATVQTELDRLQSTLDTTHQHLLRLMHIQIGVGITLLVLLSVAIALNLYSAHLQRRIKASLLVVLDSQETRIQLAMERIEMLEMALGLRKAVPVPAPPPPQVLM